MSLNPYLKFAATNRRFLGFGFLMAFASSFGQTYFIGVFGPGVQAEFGLSHTAWGTIYMLGTLGSAALLPWSGKQIDRLDLRHYTYIVFLMLILSCLFMSQVAGPFTLIVGIFLLRQSGQGLSSHIAVTSMVRYFDAGRGRALAIASLGFAAGEAILPLVAVVAISALGWRWSYLASAAFLAGLLVPCGFMLLKGHARRHRNHMKGLGEPGSSARGPVRGWTRAQVLKDRRFYLMMPGILAPSLIITAMFFHHLNLADAKGWSHTWITGSYFVFAASTVATALVAGPLIDRFGGTHLLRYMLMPLALAMVAVAMFTGAWVVWLYLGLLGICVGFAHTAVAAMWAELYGVTHLGAIKSLAAALSVFSSALGPVIMGGLMDMGVTAERVCLLFAVYVVSSAVLLARALMPGRA